MALSKVKNNWLDIEINAGDFMPAEFERIVDGSARPMDVEDVDDLERKLNIVARMGATRDEYDIPDFQKWFYEKHSREWMLMVDTIHDMESRYVDEKLEEIR